MAISVVTPPATSPVSFSEIKHHLRLEHTQEDELLIDLAKAATEHVERHIRQALIHRTLRQYSDDLPPSNRITLEGWPIAGIVSVAGFNAVGEMVEVDAGSYRVVKDERSAELVFDPSVNRAMFVNGLEVDFIAGFGETGLDVPSNVLQAIKRIIAHWYEIRGSGADGFVESLPIGIDKLLSPLRRISL